MENNWVEVSKGMPVVGEYVLVLLEGELILKGVLNSNGWSAFFADGLKRTITREVTHWMYLPALPGSEQKQQSKVTREEIAAMAMQGLLANHEYNTETTPLEVIARDSVAQADALILELSKPQP